jgi:hypothetical protein
MAELVDLFRPERRAARSARGTTVLLLRTDAGIEDLRPRVERLLEEL